MPSVPNHSLATLRTRAPILLPPSPCFQWGNGHTVWGEVLDMTVIDEIMRQPLVVKNWGSINATELVQPMEFTLRVGPHAQRS